MTNALGSNQLFCQKFRSSPFDFKLQKRVYQELDEEARDRIRSSLLKFIERHFLYVH